MWDVGFFAASSKAVGASGDSSSGKRPKMKPKVKAKVKPELNIGLTVAHGSVLDIEGKSETKSYQISVASFDKGQEGSVSYGLRVGPTGFGVAVKESKTDVYSLRRGVGRAINEGVKQAKQKVKDKIRDFLYPAPKIE